MQIICILLQTDHHAGTLLFSYHRLDAETVVSEHYKGTHEHSYNWTENSKLLEWIY